VKDRRILRPHLCDWLTYGTQSSMLLGEPLRVGPKCSRSSARCSSFLPAEAVTGMETTSVPLDC
jgi:hypothetical protein